MGNPRARRTSSRGRVVLAVATALVIASASATGQSNSTESRFQTIRTLIDADRYPEAEAAAEALVFEARADPAGSVDIDRAVDVLVEALVRNGKGAEPRTRVLAEEVIRSKERRHATSDPALAASLRALGDVHVEAGEYQRAREPSERALRIDEADLGLNHPSVADDLDHVANVLMLIEKYDEALAANDRALAIKQKLLPPVDVRTARSLEIRGTLLQRRGNYTDARSALEHALSIRERAGPPDAEMAWTLTRLGEQNRLQGNPVESKEFSERAVTLAERLLRAEHPDLASHMRFLALPVLALGDLARARSLRERALGIAEKALGSDHLGIAVHLNDLAFSFFAEGEYARAATLLDRALKIYERHLGPNHSGAITAVYNLALVNRSLGDFTTARRQFVRAISTWERVVGRDHPFVASALTQFARMLSDQGLHRQAEPLYERALAIRERTLGENHPDVARALSLLSGNALRRGQIQRAFDLSSRALSIWEDSKGRETLNHADSIRLHADIQIARGDVAGADRSYERAVAVLRRIVGPSHPDIAEIDVSRAVALGKLHDTSDSLQYALEAEAIGRSHLRLMLRDLPERQGLEYASNRPNGLNLALSLATANLDDDATNRVLDHVIRSRGVVLDEIARRRHASADATRPELAPLWAALVSARQRYANLVIRGADEQHPERFGALVEEARRDTENAERAFAAKSAAFESELSRKDVGLADIRDAMPAGTALVSFVRYDRIPIEQTVTSAAAKAPNATVSTKPIGSYVAFVLRSDGSAPAVVPLGRASAIDALVARWRVQITAAVTAPSPVEAEAAYRIAGAALRRSVWEPLQKHIAEAKTVFIVPDGTLNLVSFAALPVGRAKYVIDQAAVVHYLSAERDVATPEHPSTKAGGLLAVGGAAFDDATLFARTKTGAPVATPSGAPAMASLRAAACDSLQSMQFRPLAGTSGEIHDIAKLWTESSAELLEGRAASERAVKRDAAGRRVLHLATHGFFLGDCRPSSAGTRSVGGLTMLAKASSSSRPVSPAGRRLLTANPLLMSGLALAGANRRASAGPTDEDGILTAEEVTTINLEGVEWVVLSACDSGLGEVRVGEGVFGLRRAFQVAGARTVIMSLWSVEDAATRSWMRSLYQNRLQNHLNTADAVHAASGSILRERRAAGKSTHPFYWAAFVAAGDWR